MKSTVTVQLETDTLLKLINRLSELGGTQDVSQGVSSAIDFWLAEQAKLATGGDPASVRGYQWKTVFLPEGTVLRSWSYGDPNYARVEGDQIIHEAKPVSPNQFAQSFAKDGPCPSAANSVSGWKRSRSTDAPRRRRASAKKIQKFSKKVGRWGS